ncbi:protein tramtrack, beta isoform isoform X2 [Toxorhynchites rutilus septentrionalis]|uniref:protein tramtrack, beta isoform isoform X2 n=1 Tax=Toxorhynchites rutilus septentrionalis TaxID=329112 RepID=UPI002479630C|nr:protein tramtrack, beta isoform isoform X2 [Toxorhynchites rutilus septentrionalis]
MSVQQYCLRWNNHQPNFISVFSSLLHSESLVDVTLAAEGRQLQAHKVVLSACSSYFQSLFTANPCQHPIVILKDVQYNDLKTMVDFMYYGEVNVSTEQLPQVLKTAEMLKIKGLAEMPDASAVCKADPGKLEHPDLVGAGLGPGGTGAPDSIWGSAESQQQQAVAQQQQTQQQQYHQQLQAQQPQLRRTPSPTTNMSPAARRKRLRKTSTGSGSLSTDRIQQQQQQQHHHQQQQQQQQDEHGTNADGTINIVPHLHIQQQVDNISYSTSHSALASLAGAAGGAGNNIRIIKESPSSDVDQQQHESSQESVDETGHHIPSIIKTEDLSGVTQTIPMDISATSTSVAAVNIPQSQSQHSVAEMAKLALGLSLGQSSSSGTSSMSTSLESSFTVSTHPAAKRGRLLIRQQRIKKESDSSSSGQQYGSDLDTPDGTTIYAQNLLTVPTHHRFERQVSEPIIPTSSNVISHEGRTPGGDRSHTGHLLSVPSQQAYLVKQHSHPLLLSQTSSSLGTHQTFQAISSYSLQRQLSHPSTTAQSSTPLTLVTSSSGATHYLTPSSSLKADSDEEATSATTIPQIHLQTDRTMSPTVVIVPDVESGQQQQQHHVTSGASCLPASTSASSNNFTTATTSTTNSSSTLLTDLTTPSSIRVKSDELSRSASSPLTCSRSADFLSLESQRSSHCPVVREGPALGCNFCWNTIDAHGRILRRKTKYHCPECQTNLCIVPCFQEYHERQSAENPTPTSSDATSGGASGSGSSKSGLRNYPKSGSM